MNIKELLKNKKVVLLGIIAILLAVISISYAYYMFSESQAGNNIGGSDCFKLTYKDKNNIVLNDAIPLSEEEGSSLTPYEFTIKNVCKGAAEYDINLEKLNTSDMDDKFLRIKLDNNESFLLNSKENANLIVNQDVSSSRKIGEGLLLANEEKTYNLRMWIDEDATIEAAEKTFESKVVVISKLNKNPYQSIILNLNGGSIEGDTTLQGVVKQTLGDKLKNPTKEGYNFIGWYSTSTFDNGTGVSQDTMITNEISNLYANYTKGIYELTIDEDNGNISTHQVEYQSTYNLNTPTKVGYTFDHWEIVSENSSISDNVLTMGSEATRVKAIYNINSYTLTISNSNTCDSTHTIDYNSTYELCTPSKEGYTFSGWNYESGSLSGNTYTMGASNVEVSATWTINTYKWLVNHNKMNTDGTTYTLEETTTGQGEYNSTYPTSDIRKTYSGFTKPDPYPTSTIGVDKTPIEEGYATNNILDYNYTRNKYDLVINPNGGSYNNQTSNTTINEYYEKEITISNPSKIGYTFNGWSNEANFTNTIYKMPAGGETIEASWNANQYTITFNVNGGDTLANNTKEVTYDSTYGNLPTPTRTGYDFDGWYTEQNGGDKIETTTKVTILANQTLWAHWTIQTYTIAFNANGGSYALSTEIVTYGQTFNLSTNRPFKNGYVFTGWSESSSATTPSYIGGESYTFNSNKTLYAVWSGTMYLYNRGNEYTNITGGWNYVQAESNGKGEKNSDSFYLYYNGSGDTGSAYRTGSLNIPSGTYILHINYKKTEIRNNTASKWTGIYYLLNNSGNSNRVFSSNQTVGTYTDEQYEINLSNGDTIDIGNCDSYDYIYEVYLTPKVFTNPRIITYDANGGTGGPQPGGVYVYEGNTIELREERPQKEGYSFIGYSTNKNATTASYNTGQIYTFTSDTTLYAIYKVRNIATNVLKDYMVALTENSSTSSTNEIGETNLAYDGNSNLRYVGKNPNNYVYFNCSDYSNQNDSTCEKWRIIGKFGNNVKIIRNDSIGSYSWDSSAEGVNRGNGVNEWSQADLKTELNGIYYNAQSGTCYNAYNNGTTTCDFRTTGLKNDVTRNAIENYTWNTGAANGSQKGSYSFPAATYYANERSTYTGKQCSSGTYCNDTVTRTTSWTGKVALMYPSDYTYAVGGSVRSTCLTTNGGSFNSSGCNIYDWMYLSGIYGWTLAPRADSSYAYRVFIVRSDGDIYDGGSAYGAYAVRPAVFLKSSIAILSDGVSDGSSAHPYKLQL